MQRLFELGVHTLFVEGGSAVITGFLEQRLVDKMLVVTAPLIIGEGIPAVGDLGITGLQDARAPRKVRGRRYGNDYVWELIFDEHDDT
jgi:5-amino-6-(5-phosphoribosylamino)uracil reductase/diaminohydroxyphosphoribosylaminopyrimidine deaminase/5-amino-6-(5-phosphoribosylamino)uracil reductase